MGEVISQKQRTQLIVNYKGKAVNISSFISVHPGGSSILYEYIGQDITSVYESYNHSKRADALLETLYVKDPKCISNSIDPYKGTLYQVWSTMNLKSYVDFINSPKVIEGHMKVFDSPFLEVFSMTPWQVIPIIWFPVSMCYLYSGTLLISQTAVFWFLLGLAFWTIFEYAMHRFFFHSEEYLPDNAYVIALHYLLHGIHHAFPMDGLRLVFPPILALILLIFFKSLYNILLPLGCSHCFMSGKILGYIYYDLFHYFSHHNELEKGYLKFMKRYHLTHHYKNSFMGFGVSNHFWDIVFGTQLDISSR